MLKNAIQTPNQHVKISVWTFSLTIIVYLSFYDMYYQTAAQVFQDSHCCIYSCTVLVSQLRLSSFDVAGDPSRSQKTFCETMRVNLLLLWLLQNLMTTHWAKLTSIADPVPSNENRAIYKIIIINLIYIASFPKAQ